MKIRIALTEDNARLRKAFLGHMRSEPDLDFVIEAENGADLLLQMETVIPDLVLLDVRMPVMDGFETARLLRRQYPEVKIVVLTHIYSDDIIIEMCRIGVNGFAAKEQPLEAPSILRKIMSGGIYLPEEASLVMKSFLNRLPSMNSKCPVSLSDMERMLLESIGQGLNRTQIAALINKSPRTVEKYRSNLYQKFKVNNHQQLISEASKWSLLK